MSDRTELQQNIISEHKRDGSKSDAEIAAKLDCSASYVNKTRNEYDDTSGGNGLIWLLVLGVILLFVLAETGAF